MWNLRIEFLHYSDQVLAFTSTLRLGIAARQRESGVKVQETFVFVSETLKKKMFGLIKDSNANFDYQ